MYTPDKLDRVVHLTALPSPEPGAPLPALVAEEGHLELVYLVSESDPRWDRSSVRLVGRDSGGMLVASVRFEGPRCHFLGPPNDEAFSGHPLYERGLRPYAAFEIEQSSWIRSLERMNRVHPAHRPEYYSGYRHYVVAFHDSTFECVAMGFEVRTRGGSVHAGLREAVQWLEEVDSQGLDE